METHKMRFSKLFEKRKIVIKTLKQKPSGERLILISIESDI
jgi:hypothetical protein